MARPQSIALGGYFKTPREITPLIARHITVAREQKIALLDPRAGDGEALCDLATALYSGAPVSHQNPVEFYVCEMEKTRHAAIEKRRTGPAGDDPMDYGNTHVLHGDAFRARFSREGQYHYAHRDGVSLLYANPPYDLDPDCGRLEEKFLRRFTSSLASDGLLVFLVPHYALDRSADTLATEYSAVSCFRFPGESFDIFKQVVLFAVKRSAPLFAPDPAIRDYVLRCAESVDGMPDLGTVVAPYALPALEKPGLGTWEMARLDVTGLLRRYRPWHATVRGGRIEPIVGIEPGELRRTYPIAMPPKPAHIAAGIAAGAFNGARVSAPGLPDLLVKGVFTKDFVTVDVKVNKDGEKTGEVQVQQPKLTVTALDLSNHRYSTLRQSGDITRATGPAEMTTGDLLDRYGTSLLASMREACPVLHDPARAEDQIELPSFARPLYKAQEQAVMGLVKLLGGVECDDRRWRGAFMLGEIGSGKCLGIGTLVLRYDGGLVRAEDVREGDMLMGPDSKPRMVLGTTRGTGPLYRVVPIQGDPWICNDAHILTLVHTMSGDVFDVPVSEFAKSKRLRRRLTVGYSKKERRAIPLADGEGRTTHPREEFKQFFPESGVDFPASHGLPIDPYFLGVWYGDGTKNTNHADALTGVTVTKPDQEIRDLMIDTAEEHGLLVTEWANTGDCPSYRINRGRSPLKVNGLLNLLRVVYGDGRALPRAYLCSSRENRAAFFAGLLDTDGHLANGCFEFVQKKRQWADDACFLARSLGIRATISEKIVEGESYWRVMFSGDFTDIPTRIERKIATPRARMRVSRKGSSSARPMKRVSRTGIRVEPIGVGEYAGFQVDGDGRFLLGDFTVTHNSFCSLAAAKTIRARRTLIMCPPHLLQSWTDQARYAWPEARTVVLDSVSAVDEFALSTGPTVIAIMSREAAKLSHAYAGVTGQHCPTCGGPMPSVSADELASGRTVCQFVRYVPRGSAARISLEIALALGPALPDSPRIGIAYQGAHRERLLAAYARRSPERRKAAWTDRSGSLAPLAEKLTAAAVKSESWDSKRDGFEALTGLLVSIGSTELIERCVRIVFGLTSDDTTDYGDGSRARSLARPLLHLLPTEEHERVIAEMKSLCAEPKDPWWDWREADRTLRQDGETSRAGSEWACVDGAVTWRKHRMGSPAAAAVALEKLAGHSRWTKEGCGRFADSDESKRHKRGERLYQAVPEPRRYALAKYLTRRHPGVIDLLISDECFVRGTLVSGRPIETIGVGDEIDAFDEATGNMRKRRVVRLFRGAPSALVRVSVGGHTSFVCTPAHPIWTQRGWIRAAELTGDDSVLLATHDFSGDEEDKSNVQQMRWTRSELRPCLAEPVLQAVRSPSAGGEEAEVERAVLHVRDAPVAGRPSGEPGKVSRSGELSSVHSGALGERRATVGRRVCRVRQLDRADRAQGGACSEDGSRVLRPGVLEAVSEGEDRRGRAQNAGARQVDYLGADAHQQPDEVSGDARQGERVAAGQGPWAGQARRQWGSDAGAAEAPRGRARVGDRGHRRDEEAERLGVAQPLRDRHREPREDDRGGGGRVESPPGGQTSLGCAEGRVSAWARVGRVEVLERGSDGTFGGVCPDGLVYNLEVEEFHTYTANGVVVHNCQDYNSATSAQSFAASRIIGTGVPTLLLTGSVMNGYADSLFTNQWNIDPEFRAEFARDERTLFVRRYGYLKQLVEQKEDGKVVAWGAQSDRQETSRIIGTAPGVLPVYMLRYLLRKSVTLHKADLALELPPNYERVAFIEPTEEIRARYEAMAKALKEAIKKDRFNPDLAGKLFGQMSELPSYLDRTTNDTGNRADGSYVVAYPEDCGGMVVAAYDGLPSSTITPKERWMLDTLKRELSDGRRTMVFAHHSQCGILQRLVRLITAETGARTALLLADKVQAKKREDWINKHVVDTGTDVLVVNGTAVQTGLNNLVHFQNIIWMENPGANPVAYDQANGRIDRIGKKAETRIYFPVYNNTVQVLAHKLLLHKVGVMRATNGLDASSALAAAGVGDAGEFDAFSVGRVLFEMMERGEAMGSVRAVQSAPVVVPIARPAAPQKMRQLRLF